MEIKRTCPIDGCKFFDYGKSFIQTENHPKNTPRFLIEAICTIFEGDRSEKYYLCAPCKGEHTYAKKDLFESKAFEFTPIMNDKEVLVFRKFGFFNKDETNEYKKAYTSQEMWGDKKEIIKEVKVKELLNTNEKIISATKRGDPIMCRFTYKEKNSDKHAIIDFPIKTINVHKNKWQIDTGIIPFPDLIGYYPYQIFSFDLAYIAFNSFKFVEVLKRKLFNPISDFWIVHSCDLVKINNPEIYLYSV